MLIKQASSSLLPSWTRLTIKSFFIPVPNLLPWRRFKTLKHSRKVLSVTDPLEDKPGLVAHTGKDSTSIFKLCMGEILVTKGRGNRIALEGARLVEEALLCGLILEKLFLSKTLKSLPAFAAALEQEKGGVEVHRVGLKAMETWSELTTPPGIIGIFRKPNTDDSSISVKRNEGPLPVTVICENIREPGNLGSILRTAAGAGVAEVLLGKGCVEPWNMKVLRGGCGAHFRIPISVHDNPSVLEKKIRPSLSSVSGKGTLLICDSNDENPALPPPLRSTSIDYRDIDYCRYPHSYLLLGGETGLINSSLSDLVKTLPVEPVRVRIPLQNGVESLNVGSAFSIIVFEIVRQFRAKLTNGLIT